MNSIRYDQGTFSYALMLGVLSMQVAHIAPNLELSGHGRNRLYHFADSRATYDYSSGDLYAQFLTRAEHTRTDSIAKPRTELGRRLLEYRNAALAKGMRTLSIDEIESILKEGRGASA